MPLGLHSKCKEQLTEHLKTVLPKIEVAHGSALSIGTMRALEPGDRILPASGPVADRIQALLGERPWSLFIADTLTRRIETWAGFSQDTAKQLLIDLPTFADVDETANGLVQAFDSLPWRYTHSFYLGETLRTPLSHFANFAVSDRMSIRLADAALREEFRADPGAIGSLADPLLQITRWENDGAYLQVQTDGHVRHYGAGKPVDEAEELVRAFFGLGLALGVFEHNPWQLPDQPNKSPTRFIHRRLGEDRWSLDSAHFMGRSLAEGIAEIRVNQSSALPIELGERDIRRLRTELQRIAICFSHHDKLKNVVQAARWLFDSHTGHNELLSFVQAMVSLEIILGDKEASDLMGLGELLRNRCAYLLGKTRSERDSILEEFGEIYRVRSLIVHRGKSTLSSDDRKRFYKLRDLCARVIDAELRLIENELSQDADVEAALRI